MRIIRILEVPTAGVLDSEHPFAGAVQDLARRLHRAAYPEQVRRLADAHTTWLMCVGWEIPATYRDVRRPVNDYLFTRMMYAAGAPTLCWLQIAEGELIPEAEITSPPVRALTEMASAVAALDDDLYSYGKDLWFARNVWRRSPRYNSMIEVFMSEQGISRDQALAECVRLRDRIVARFHDLRAHTAEAASAPLTRYLNNLGSSCGEISNGVSKLLDTPTRMAPTPTRSSPPAPSRMLRRRRENPTSLRLTGGGTDTTALDSYGGPCPVPD
ncbi:terpene synthase family protein [Nocardia thraciensis]